MQMEESSALLIESMEAESESMFCSSRMMDDGIIDPIDTREVLIFALETCMESGYRGTEPNTFGVARL